MVCVDLARKLWKENAEELKASKAGGAGVSSSAGAASDPSGGVSKPTPKVKAQTAEAKPVETKKEPDPAREPAAGVKAPETPPQANQPGSSSTGPGDDVTYQQTEAAYDFAALLDCLDSDDKLQKVVYLFLTRVYSVFRPEKLPQVGELLAKYDLKLKTLVGAVAEGSCPWSH